MAPDFSWRGFIATCRCSDFFQFANSADKLEGPGCKLIDRAIEFLGDQGRLGFDFGTVLKSPRAGQGGDPSDACRDALIGEDFQGADFSGIARVGSAAEFARKISHADHADWIGVLFSEEHHRTEFAGLG